MTENETYSSLPLFQVLELRGRAFQEYGQAAVVQSIVDRLPDIAREVASPLAKTEKVGKAVKLRAFEHPGPCFKVVGSVRFEITIKRKAACTLRVLVVVRGRASPR